MPTQSRSAGRNDWLTHLSGHSSENPDCVLVTVVETQGSAPREAGSKMLVKENDCVGTIGGGHLEYKLIALSREMLSDEDEATCKLVRLPLGASLGQCCGGHVSLHLEKISTADCPWVRTALELFQNKVPTLMVTSLVECTAGDENNKRSNRILVTEKENFGSFGSLQLDALAAESAAKLFASQESGNQPPQAQVIDGLLYDPIHAAPFDLVIFGAGHVGQAVVKIAKNLPFDIVWIDSREELFRNVPDAPELTKILSDEPASEVATLAGNSLVLVMTHSHQLDLSICEKVLQRSDITYCGLIGSITKKRRFKRQLTDRGVSKELLARLVCPIGVPGINGKHPAQIAISITAELLQITERMEQLVHPESIPDATRSGA